jgi:hypothetical protein
MLLHKTTSTGFAFSMDFLSLRLLALAAYSNVQDKKVGSAAIGSLIALILPFFFICIQIIFEVLDNKRYFDCLSIIST